MHVGHLRLTAERKKEGARKAASTRKTKAASRRKEKKSNKADGEFLNFIQREIALPNCYSIISKIAICSHCNTASVFTSPEPPPADTNIWCCCQDVEYGICFFVKEMLVLKSGSILIALGSYSVLTVMVRGFYILIECRQ